MSELPKIAEDYAGDLARAGAAASKRPGRGSALARAEPRGWSASKVKKTSRFHLARHKLEEAVAAAPASEGSRGLARGAARPPRLASRARRAEQGRLKGGGPLLAGKGKASFIAKASQRAEEARAAAAAAGRAAAGAGGRPPPRASRGALKGRGKASQLALLRRSFLSLAPARRGGRARRRPAPRGRRWGGGEPARLAAGQARGASAGAGGSPASHRRLAADPPRGCRRAPLTRPRGAPASGAASGLPSLLAAPKRARDFAQRPAVPPSAVASEQRAERRREAEPARAPRGGGGGGAAPPALGPPRAATRLALSNCARLSYQQGRSTEQ